MEQRTVKRSGFSGHYRYFGFDPYGSYSRTIDGFVRTSPVLHVIVILKKTDKTTDEENVKDSEKMEKKENQEKTDKSSTENKSEKESDNGSAEKKPESELKRKSFILVALEYNSRRAFHRSNLNLSGS